MLKSSNLQILLQSSLVQAILHELPLSRGKVVVHGVVSYASQVPWLFTGSVQQNILFGSPLDKKRYNKVRKYDMNFAIVYILHKYFI